MISEPADQAKDKLNFDDTSIAFEKMTHKDLQRANWLFSLMNFPRLIKIGNPILKWSIKNNLPIHKLVKNTIFKQFCGGENLEEVKKVVDELKQYSVNAILDYGVEAKQDEKDFEQTKNYLIDKINYALQEPNINIISSKLTGLIKFDLLQKITEKKPLTANEQLEYDCGKSRVKEICEKAYQAKVQIYFDAEESWIQNAIDTIVTEMMELFNCETPIVFNTIQLYRKDKLSYLKEAYRKSLDDCYILAVKLVRGAYMEKEAKRAHELNCKNPIQDNKAATDRDFDLALQFCVEHLGKMAVCCASHNEKSNLLLADLIDKSALANNHPLISFAQLYGMSDYMTFNLAKKGFYSCKYLPYGPLKEVIPYLIRRANENTSVDGQMGKELKFIRKEIKRRKALG